jgi:hypothetical protein
MSAQTPNYFTLIDLVALNSMEGKQIEKITYHVWENRVNPDPNELFESLDWLELEFTDNSIICFTAAEESDGIKLIEFNLDEERARITALFGNKIQLVSHDMTFSETWIQATMLPITAVELMADKTQQYLNNAMMLRFSDHQMLIGLNPHEGLLVELVEEDEA